MQKNAGKKTKTGSVKKKKKSMTREDTTFKIKQETTKLKPKIMTVCCHNKGLKMS